MSNSLETRETTQKSQQPSWRPSEADKNTWSTLFYCFLPCNRLFTCSQMTSSEGFSQLWIQNRVWPGPNGASQIEGASNNLEEGLSKMASHTEAWSSWPGKAGYLIPASQSPNLTNSALRPLKLVSQLELRGEQPTHAPRSKVDMQTRGCWGTT